MSVGLFKGVSFVIRRAADTWRDCPRRRLQIIRANKETAVGSPLHEGQCSGVVCVVNRWNRQQYEREEASPFPAIHVSSGPLLDTADIGQSILSLGVPYFRPTACRVNERNMSTE